MSYYRCPFSPIFDRLFFVCFLLQLSRFYSPVMFSTSLKLLIPNFLNENWTVKFVSRNANDSFTLTESISFYSFLINNIKKYIQFDKIPSFLLVFHHWRLVHLSRPSIVDHRHREIVERDFDLVLFEIYVKFYIRINLHNLWCRNIVRDTEISDRFRNDLCFDIWKIE